MPDELTKVIILGAAGTGLMMAETIRRSEQFTLAGLLDDDPEKQVRGYEDHEVLGPLDCWKDLPDDWLFLSSLYGPKHNTHFADVVERLAIPIERWAVVIDPTAIVAPSVQVAGGAFIGPACVVEPESQLGPWTALLGSVHVAHHARLGSYVACANRVSLCGGVEVGRAAFLGAGSCVREYIRIGPRAIVGLGSVVVRDVAEDTTVAGNPARPLAT